MVTLFVVIAVALIAALLGFFIGRATGDQQRIKDDYEARLQKAEHELMAYRQQVSEHFHGTAQLVEQMNDNYRAVYQHLAKGAQQLAQGEIMPAYSGSVIDAEAREERLTADAKELDIDSTQEGNDEKEPTSVEPANPKEQAESARKAGL